MHPETQPAAVACLLYLDDIEGRDGATAFVPCKVRATTIVTPPLLRMLGHSPKRHRCCGWQGPDDPAYQWPLIRTPGAGPWPWINDRTAAEAMFDEIGPPEAAALRASLYEREVRMRYRAGDALLYRLDTWHRGTFIQPVRHTSPPFFPPSLPPSLSASLALSTRSVSCAL